VVEGEAVRNRSPFEASLYRELGATLAHNAIGYAGPGTQITESLETMDNDTAVVAFHSSTLGG
jgi:hypothetical protein